MDIERVLQRFEALRDPKAVAGMERFGIKAKMAYGVQMPVLRTMGKEIGKDHTLALRLWAIDCRETRILASIIENPDTLTENQMEEWVHDFDSWEICDQTIMNLFGPSKFAWKKAVEWSGRKEEFVKRAGFVLMAWLGVHDKDSTSEAFLAFLPIIEEASTDDRGFVKKAVNWALRQIGKRDLVLNRKALTLARRLRGSKAVSARWIGSDAFKELDDPRTKKRVSIRDRGLRTRWRKGT